MKLPWFDAVVFHGACSDLICCFEIGDVVCAGTSNHLLRRKNRSR
jgi:hypothetical protein